MTPSTKTSQARNAIVLGLIGLGLGQIFGCGSEEEPREVYSTYASAPNGYRAGPPVHTRYVSSPTIIGPDESSTSNGSHFNPYDDPGYRRWQEQKSESWVRTFRNPYLNP
jgi:hypothetical protein